MWYVATLGYTPEVLLDISNVPNTTKVLLLHGDLNKKQVASNEKADTLLELMALPHEFYELPEPWNFKACLEGLRDAMDAYVDEEDHVISASGSTEVLNSAATLYGVLHGAPVRYVNRNARTTDVVDYGLLHTALGSKGTKHDIISIVTEAGGEAQMSDITKHLNVSKPSASEAFRRLSDAHIITIESDPKDGRIRHVRLEPGLWPLASLVGKPNQSR